MKKKIAIITFMVCMSLLTGCQEQKEEKPLVTTEAETIKIEQNETKDQKNSEETNTMEEQKPQMTDEITEKTSQVIEGTQLVDGKEVPVKVTFLMEGVERGSAAYEILAKGNEEVKKPEEGQEYLIVTFNVSYDAGEADELFMSENRGSLESGRLYFALSNGESNAEEVTEYLDNSIYELSIAKGESKQGAVAFLHKKDSLEPLNFIGFNKVIHFEISK